MPQEKKSNGTDDTAGNIDRTDAQKIETNRSRCQMTDQETEPAKHKVNEQTDNSTVAP